MTGAPSDQPIVAVIHSGPETVGPADLVFAECFPGARPRHVVDTRLDRPGETAGIESRGLAVGLVNQAIADGADAVLLCPSRLGPVAHSVAGDMPVPVLAPDETMFAHVDALRPARVAVLGPSEAGLVDIVGRMNGYLASLDRAAGVATAETRIIGTSVTRTAEAAADDDQALLIAVVETARRVALNTDLIVLEDFTLAPAAAAVRSAVSAPVLSSSHLTVEVLRGLLL